MESPSASRAVSPRIATLRQQLEAGDRAALGAFWQQVEAEGAPLVEEIAGDGEHRLLTVVYRSAQPLRNVAVFMGIERQGDMRHNQLVRVEETDLWYRTYRVRSDLRVGYHISPDDPLIAPLEIEVAAQAAYIAERAPMWTADAFNPKQVAFAPGQAPQSYLELPNAPPQPYIEKRAGVPEGAIEREDLDRDLFGEGRRIWTYLPPGYDPAAGSYPLVLQFDGWISRKLGLHATLDNMTAEGIIPPVVCVMMHNIDRMKELACNAAFTDWLADGFLPMWRQKYAITDDPSRTVVTGMSLGGLAAAFCGLRRPEVFGNVLSQSGSFWWRPDDDPSGDWQWLTRQFEASPQLPLRFYMNVGLLEAAKRQSAPEYPSMVEANRALRDVLLAKGYDVEYDEFNGGHDYVSWRGSIADGLAALLGGQR